MGVREGSLCRSHPLTSKGSLFHIVQVFSGSAIDIIQCSQFLWVPSHPRFPLLQAVSILVPSGYALRSIEHSSVVHSCDWCRGSFSICSPCELAFLQYDASATLTSAAAHEELCVRILLFAAQQK